MYRIHKRLEISAAHRLDLNYESKCSQIHGHNWMIDVYMQSEELDENGMVCDFTLIKQRVKDRLDHRFLNEVLDVNPTAENIAKWIADQLGEKCYLVRVKESEGNTAEYER